MIKYLLSFVIIAVLLPLSMKADWVPVDNNRSANTPPQVTILSDDYSGTVIKIDLSGFRTSEILSEGKTYQSVDLLNEIFTTKEGFPEVPYISKVLAVPDQAGISVEVLEVGEIQTFKNIQLPPARPSWFEGDEEPAYLENGDAFLSSAVYPTDYVSLDPPSVFRDFRIARVSVYPVRYLAAEQEIQVASSITIRVNYGSGDVINPKTSSKTAIAPSFAKLYKSFIFNYDEVLESVYNGKEDGQELMLCIMPDEFTESFQIYADWKRQSGTDIHVTAFSDINANANDPSIIKEHITDAYNDWEVPPTYVLIVGDEGVFPHKIVNYDYSFPNEDYFVEIEGNDHFPEMMIGRFTNQGDYRMQVMINKFIMYEKTPYTDETDWFKKGICCSNNAYESQVETKRYAAARMMVEGEFISVDTLMSDGSGWWGGDCSMDLQDVVDCIEDGRSYLNYRGEGWYSGWSANCYQFEVSDVGGLNNGEKFTFVTSIGCGVAGFQSYGGNCFGEEWVQLGSLTQPRGGIGFVGPVSNTHTTYNNKIDKGIYTGMFMEGMDTPGQALLRGKLYMYNVYGTDDWVEYHYRVFSVLGDPSIHIWKDVPLNVDVAHESYIDVGNNDFEVTLTFSESGDPVPNAEVCLLGQDIYVTGVTDSTGYLMLNIVPELEQEIIITVRGGNVYPYQASIEVGQPEELVEPLGEPAIVDLDGNQDGLMNPNETCEMEVTLKNWGTLTASNVVGILTAASGPYVTVLTPDPVSFGTLSPGNTNSGEPFQFSISEDCPVGEIITVILNVTSSTNNWEFIYNFEISGCDLQFHSYVVNDVLGGNANYRMDPGEMVNIALSILNVGDDLAPDVMGILSSSDPYISIEDSIGTFGTLDINEVLLNDENYFKVNVDASCPSNYEAQFSVKLYTENGNYPYETIPEFTMPVAKITSNDFSGPDAYGYYAYSSSDYFEQSPVYNWVEIEDVGTIINVPGISDYTKTVNLPFSFQYYGVDYSQLRISTDGWIAFGSGTQTAPLNVALPANDNVAGMSAVFWDDLYDDAVTDCDILYYYDNSNNRFIIEWDSITHNFFASEPKKEVFQAILLDPDHYSTPTGDGELIFQYKNVEEIESNTIGIENHTQDIGLQYVFDAQYNPTALEIQNEYAIKFTTNPPFVAIITSDEEHEAGNLNLTGYSLDQNYPNPFKTSTWIYYTLPEAGRVVLTVYNARGELVATLQDGFVQTGNHSVEWNGLNDSGNQAGSGIYFYRIQSEGFVETMKMFKLK